MEVGFGSGEGASGVNEYYKFIGEKEYISYTGFCRICGVSRILHVHTRMERRKVIVLLVATPGLWTLSMLLWIRISGS